MEAFKMDAKTHSENRIAFTKDIVDAATTDLAHARVGYAAARTPERSIMIQQSCMSETNVLGSNIGHKNLP